MENVGSSRLRPPTPEAIARFWTKVNKTERCWLWTGFIHNGYGQAYVCGMAWRAHRFSFFLEHNFLPQHPLQLDHLCRTRACVNPAHLEPVTPRENILRSAGISALNARKTHCNKGHVLPEAGTDGFRRCRVCLRGIQREWLREKAVAAMIARSAEWTRRPIHDYPRRDDLRIGRRRACEGRQRHWFTAYGNRGVAVPFCILCGAVGPETTHCRACGGRYAHARPCRPCVSGDPACTCEMYPDTNEVQAWRANR